jgi:hypothetical protein
VEILPGRLTVYEHLIEKDQGYLKVTITLEDAVAEGALRCLDDMPAWYISGTTLSNVSTGYARGAVSGDTMVGRTATPNSHRG